MATSTGFGRIPRAASAAAMAALLGLTLWLYVGEPGADALDKAPEAELHEIRCQRRAKATDGDDDGTGGDDFLDRP